MSLPPYVVVLVTGDVTYFAFRSDYKDLASWMLKGLAMSYAATGTHGKGSLVYQPSNGSSTTIETLDFLWLLLLAAPQGL